MKFIKLLSAAYVNGSLRHPHEGVLHVEDDEALRLVGDKVGEDVTADFSAKENKSAPVESISAESGATAGAEPTGEPHQSEVAPQAPEQSKPSRRKAAADKE